MTDDRAGQAPHGPDTAATGSFPASPDAMLGLWASWMEDAFRSAHSLTQASPAWWQLTPAGLGGKETVPGVQQLEGFLTHDPYLRSIDQIWNANPLHDVVPVDWAEIARALRWLWLRALRDPTRTMSSATQFSADVLKSAVETWNEWSRRWWGIVGDAGGAASSSDKRFAAPEWQLNPAYRTLKDLYLLASDWLLKQPEADGLSEAERQRLRFHLHQFVDAMSPTLLLMSNPAALRRAFETGGTSLTDGLRNLTSDLKAGRLSMVDESAFAPGRNLALTPGKVVHRSKLIELIQYAPTTPTVHSVPLLIIPPWINKFYILDMQPKNSMVRYLVEQGFTVFMVSWKNPDASMDETTISDYVDLGVLEASDVVRDICGSKTLNVMGYCIGGTLLTMSLAWLAAKRDTRFASATFMVSLQDFSRVGDTAVFLGEETVDFIEQQMMERGYLDSREMSNMFNLLRSNDLIWSNVVNNYLMGQKPPAFDLLYWNSDGTRMARLAHSWYLRNTYVENNLVKPGKVELKGERLDLSRITLDTYAVGAEKDHIVPWDAAWRITQLFSGKVRYVLASSGHIAGMINPPGGKGAFWINENQAATPAQWRGEATRHDGSWWTDWTAWLAAHAGERVKPPAVGNAAHPPLADAPGTYVLEK
jgi:polyhydroxyalkanoate synthase